MNREEIERLIPHRAPFLLLDDVTAISAESVEATYTLRPDDDLWSRIYSGHYPGSPITPGVLLCEMLFQAAAVMLGQAARDAGLAGVPVVTRITSAKFKSMVLPGDTVTIRARLKERMANAFFMKGDIHANGTVSLQAEFAVALAEAGAPA
ncbi:MAG: beta-hydroxyacyl-ACP dehydratase [Planctomycetaceae bacterium]|nr:beta-hydroxyacyl-ACP dehydratase [Planctomycetaceae bacterium]